MNSTSGQRPLDSILFHSISQVDFVHTLVASIDFWHQRLGHANLHVVHHLLSSHKKNMTIILHLYVMVVLLARFINLCFPL
ncbi:hypothetical protein LINGRAHAP2_LOCUS17936 [Linum grandiflorum]